AFSCKAGEFLDMKAQACKPCAEGTYSLGTGVRFDEWDEVPHGFANVATNLEVDDGFGDAVENCTASTWVPLGDYMASNTDECTATLMYAVNLKQSGTVSFEYIYPDSSIRWRPGPPRAPHLCPGGMPLGKGEVMRGAGRACVPRWGGEMGIPLPAGWRQGIPWGRRYGPLAGLAQPPPPLPPGQTQLMFKWAEPKICSEELPQAAKLPPSGVKTKCPPCNPGFAKSDGSACQPCPYGSYSNGSGCLSCPAGTEPALGLEYKWWNVLPPNMETTVLSGINFEYKGMAGSWEVAGDYIYTAAGASDNDFMILTLVVPGFSPPSPVLEDAESKEVARITFVFETVCSVSCELYFMVGINSRTNTPVETWTGPKGKQSYTYIVEKNATMSFTWAFQRTPYHEAGRRYTSDVAKLYSVNVTNVLGGVASFCRRCAPEPAGSCAPCPPGSAVDRGSGACQPCPPGTYLRGHPSDGIPACHPCGPGTRSNQLRSLCYNNCSFSLALPGRILHYDFSALAAGTAFASGPSFTAKGLKYFHHFNISLCGNQGTCDGCTFHFLWVTGEGCPRCSASHYRPIVGACLGGIQRTTYVWREPRLCRGGLSLPPQKVRGCRSVDFWLKVGISAGTCAAILLATLAAYFWKKNQKLEYKYSKLVMNAAAKESELPAPDSCAIMEGEDAEDDLVFASKKSLFGKIKSLTSK
ncbi:K1324 protein, partial [Scopus umbretta]|nr:K1324 protein [Scopus umbretta]